MASFNRVILVGNLTRDPELRHAPSGSAVAEMRLAVSETYRDRQTQQPREVVCYVDVVAWERQAELCKQYLAKGRPVLIEGRLTYDEWKNAQGETRNKLRVRADRVQFLGSPSTGRREEAHDGPPPAAAASAPAAPSAPAEADDSDFNPPGVAAADDENLPF